MSNSTVPNCWTDQDNVLFAVYTDSTIAVSGLLVVGYGICLYLVYKDAKVPFVVKITVILLLSNIGALLTA